jgi:hypothetical protein
LTINQNFSKFETGEKVRLTSLATFSHNFKFSNFTQNLGIVLCAAYSLTRSIRTRWQALHHTREPHLSTGSYGPTSLSRASLSERGTFHLSSSHLSQKFSNYYWVPLSRGRFYGFYVRRADGGREQSAIASQGSRAISHFLSL